MAVVAHPAPALAAALHPAPVIAAAALPAVGLAVVVPPAPVMAAAALPAIGLAVAVPPAPAKVLAVQQVLAVAVQPVDAAVAPAPRDVIIFYDFENAHNAAADLQRLMLQHPSWSLKVFARADTPLGAVRPTDNVEILRSDTLATEAADTLLCFHAGIEHAVRPPATRFVIVCGAERRYSELEASLNRLRGPIPAAKLVSLEVGREHFFFAEVVAVTR